jgi:transposase
MYKYAVATKNGRELYLSLGYVVLMIWGIKYISGSFFEAAAYERLQQDKYSSFDGLFSILTSILKEASFMRQLQYNIGIFPSYFMFTMAIVTLSSYRNHKEVLQYPLI